MAEIQISSGNYNEGIVNESYNNIKSICPHCGKSLIIAKDNEPVFYPVLEPQVIDPEPMPESRFAPPVDPESMPESRFAPPVDPEPMPESRFAPPVDPEPQPEAPFATPVEPEPQPEVQFATPVDPQVEPMPEQQYQPVPEMQFEPPPEQQHSKNSVSLVLGILGLVVSFIPGIAFVLALISLITGCMKKYTAGIVLGAIGVGINIIILLCDFGLYPTGDMQNTTSNPQTPNCIGNMKQIGVALNTYWFDYDVLPPAVGDDGMDLLRSSGVLADLNAYKCPSSQKTSSYIYLGEGFKNTDPAITPVVIELPGNHEDCINVLYMDASCKTLTLPKDKSSKLSDVVKFVARYLPETEQVRLLKNAKRYAK